MYKYLVYEIINEVAKITFNRPEQLNAMNRALMDEIAEAFKKANDDEKVKVVVVTGNGRAFMAGADIKEYANQTDAQFKSFQQKGWEIYKYAERGKKPFIAMVNGFALGGGFEIANACDMIIASDNAKFGLPEVHLGLVPGGGGTQRLVQKIGLNRVKEMLYLGGKFSAQVMSEWGIVNYVVAEEKLEEFTMEIADKLSRRESKAIEELKKLAYLSTEPIELDTRLVAEGDSVYELFNSVEAKMRINQFIKKNQ